MAEAQVRVPDTEVKVPDTKVRTPEKHHRGDKSRKGSESDQVQNRRQEALKLDKQLQKKKYSRPLDDKAVDDISKLLTNMGVAKEKWLPVGTRSVKFHPLFGTDEVKESDMVSVATTRLQCITAMWNYEIKSLEELRLDDHIAGFRYRGEATGKKLFKKSSMKPRTVFLNGDDVDDWTQTGTLEVAFESVEGDDEKQESEMVAVHTTLHQCITAMVEYENKSLEELRMEDYVAGLFAIKKYDYNTQPCKNWYEDLTGKRQGTAKHEFVPYSDSIRPDRWGRFPVQDHSMGLSQFISRIEKSQCISRMPEYEHQGFEELRLVDYLAARRGPRGPMYKASEEELMHLKIQYDMEVCIFVRLGGIEVKQKGIIKFIGRLPDKVFGKIYVGIELEKPIGDGDGRYKDIRLFRTKPNHAKIVSLGAVLPVELFEEFHTDDSDTEDMVEQEPANFQAISVGGQKQCIVCYSRPVEIFFSPCGHASCCNDCSAGITDCPMCRTGISEKKRVFLP